MHTMPMLAGQIIFNEGDGSDQAYVIASGEVEIIKKTGQKTVLLAALGPGQIFGEMGIIDDSPRSASAIAKREGELRVITRDMIAQVIQGQSDEFALLLRALIERLRESNQMLSRYIDYHDTMSLDTGNSSQQPKAPASDVRRIILKPHKDTLADQMPGNGIVVSSLPFRVGSIPAGEEANPLDWNNFYVQGADPNVMARNHFSIQRTSEGLIVSDRGTPTGTLVNGIKIGGGESNYKAPLHVGTNVIAAGGEYSIYQFEVVCEA